MDTVTGQLAALRAAPTESHVRRVGMARAAFQTASGDVLNASMDRARRLAHGQRTNEAALTRALERQVEAAQALAQVEGEHDGR